MGMQKQLEDALTQLQECQVTYAQQQRLVDDQQRAVNTLKMQSQVANTAEAACTANARVAAAGAAAAHAQRAAAEETEEDEDADEEEQLGPEEHELLKKLRGLEAEKRM